MTSASDQAMDVHYNQCFEKRASPSGLQFDPIQVSKLRVVETGKKCRVLYLVCKKKGFFH